MPARFVRHRAIGGALLLGSLLLLAEGCLSPTPRPLYHQELSPLAVQIAERIAAAIEQDLREHPQSREAHLLQRFYTRTGGRSAWIKPQGIAAAADQLIETLEQSAVDGLPPQRYAPAALRELLLPVTAQKESLSGWSPERIAATDMALSRAFFRYAGDNLWGQERSWRSRGDWHRQPRSIDPVALLDLALELDAMPSALREILPRQPEYLRLRQALKRYRQIETLGGWRPLAGSEPLHPGESAPGVALLRKRLQLEGDLSGTAENPELFDAGLEQALRAFQRRHGLGADGTLGPRTLAALNLPVRSRIDQLERNMERWRWEARATSAEEIRINLADFSLAVNAGPSTFSMPVVIGRRQRPTPLFSSQLEALVFSPYWYVPPSLLGETLPRIAADPSYLRRNHYEVLDREGVPLRIDRDLGRQWQRGEIDAALRQQPGPWNPMGEIKFLLPNPWSIYLHDTPQKTLFSRNDRAFSSGCIRLAQPQRLAHWLLEREKYSTEQIRQLFEAGTPRLVSLSQPVALKIGYWTAWVDADDRVHFREDIYGRDRKLARELHQQQLPTLARLGSQQAAQTPSIAD